MTIVITGAGSGGHITPVLAVAKELKRRQPGVQLIYIGQKGDSLGDLPADSPDIDEIYTVRAGKLRRYHGEGLRQLLDLPTQFKNLRDIIYTLAGIVQSRRLLRALKPDAIFIKGGFVGVPVGLAAASLGIKYVTHDSDAIPGLANRLIARWATRHAVALPAEAYKYPATKTVSTGIPVQADFKAVTDEMKTRYRGEINVPAKARLLFIVGGGLGSQRVNRAVGEALPHLLDEFHDLYVVHGVGRQNEGEMQIYYDDRLSEAQQGRVRIHGYIGDLYRYSGAADLVITRAGATQLAEFALQGKACIVIPSPFLAAGHQLQNANYLAEQKAAAILGEADLLADPHRIAKLTSDLLKNKKRREELGNNLAQFAKPEATRHLADLIVELT